MWLTWTVNSGAKRGTFFDERSVPHEAGVSGWPEDPPEARGCRCGMREVWMLKWWRRWQGWRWYREGSVPGDRLAKCSKAKRKSKLKKTLEVVWRNRNIGGKGIYPIRVTRRSYNIHGGSNVRSDRLTVLDPCAREALWVCRRLAELHSFVPVYHNNSLEASGRFPDRFGSHVWEKREGRSNIAALIGRQGCRSVRTGAMVQHIDGMYSVPCSLVYFNRTPVCKYVGEAPCRESLPSNWALFWARWQQKSMRNG